MKNIFLITTNIYFPLREIFYNWGPDVGTSCLHHSCHEKKSTLSFLLQVYLRVKLDFMQCFIHQLSKVLSFLNIAYWGVEFFFYRNHDFSFDEDSVKTGLKPHKLKVSVRPLWLSQLLFPLLAANYEKSSQNPWFGLSLKRFTHKFL